MSSQSFSGRYKSWVLLLCFLMMASNYIDRSIIIILAQPIKDAFGLSDMQIGILGGLAFSVLFIVAGFPLARLADKRNRVVIISASIAVWSAMTALCGIAQSFVQLLLFRAGVGIGEAGASPAAQSLLADYFAPQKRASAFSVFALGGPVGGLFGAIAAGAVAQAHGWRAAFFLVGVPGLLLAMLFKLTVREPQRGAQDAAAGAFRGDEAPAPSLWAVTLHLFGLRTFVQIVLGGAIANFAFQGIFQFTAVAFVRRFGIGLGEVGLVIGLITGLCGGLGMLAGGFGSDWAARRDRRWYVWLSGIGLLLCAPLYAAAFLQGSWTAAALMLIAPAVLSYMFIAPLLSITQNLVRPRMRATAVAVMTLVTASIGVTTGPVVVGWLSDRLAASHFASTGLGSFAALCAPGASLESSAEAVRSACQAASADGVQQAILACTVLFVWAGIHFLLASRTIREELASAERGEYLSYARAVSSRALAE